MIHKFDRSRCEQIANELLTSLAEEIGRACNTSIEVTLSGEPEDTLVEPDASRVKLMLRGSARGAILLEMPPDEAARLAALLPPSESGEPASTPSAALVQFILTVVQVIAPRVGQHGQMYMSPSVTRDRGASFTKITAAMFTDPDGNIFRVSLYMDENAMDSLSVATPNVNPAKNPAMAEAGDPEAAAAEGPNLNLVMDVELDVTLRFGKRQMTLREVLELASGSVVELDRQVDEPVELLLDGKVIARGEAVVIDGNYGLRVTEVPQPVNPQQFRIS